MSVIDSTVLKTLLRQPIEKISVDTIRCLAMDAVQAANSGHPGTPMALAPVGYTLWKHHLKHNPADPTWFNRDRFVLSGGHASMLLYALLHLTGYDLQLEDLRNFRQFGSRTPGHPENFITPGVETTTGPLGQGLLNAVGMAIAELHMSAVYNRPNHQLVDHHTFAICGDGDLMEGISQEAISLAGHLGLHKLTFIWDDNRITIDGKTDITFSEDVKKRFESAGWHVINVGDNAEDLERLSQAFDAAKAENEKPTLIIVQTHIGFGSPKKQDTPAAHGSPLGKEEIKLAKKSYGWPEEEDFLVPEPVKVHFSCLEKGKADQLAWEKKLEAYEKAHPALFAAFTSALSGKLPENWDANFPKFTLENGNMATRAASGKILKSFTDKIPSFFGGSADLTGSNKTFIEGSGEFSKENPDARNVRWGIREGVMAGACNGISLHGGLRPYAATFLVFSDYARPAIRLAALMSLPVIYVMTHDSIGVGEDGPTHQPVEHLASLRAIPNLHVIRPADANETAIAWQQAMTRTDGPTLLVLSRQTLPLMAGKDFESAQNARFGGYVLRKSTLKKDPSIILIATGSEVHLAVEAQKRLEKENIATNVVSFPCIEIFRQQDPAYQEQVLPKTILRRIAIEAASPQGWHEWIGLSGGFVGMTSFGASAPAPLLFEHFKITSSAIIQHARQLSTVAPLA